MNEDLIHINDGARIVLMTTKDTIEGYCAGWLARRTLVDQGKHEVDWFELKLNQGFPPLDVDGKHVILCGIAFSKDILLLLQKRARSINVFDYDLGSKEKIGGIRFVKIMPNYTPARMLWNFLKVTLQLKTKSGPTIFEYAPFLIDVSETEKLWKWPNINQFLVCYAINNGFERSFTAWDELACRDLSGLEDLGRELQQNPEKILNQKENENGSKIKKVERRQSAAQKRARSKAGSGQSKTTGKS